MDWSAVTSSGDGRRNDDLVRVIGHGGVVDVLVLDGATSLAGCDYVDRDAGDPAWFVRRFADAFAAAAGTADAADAADAAGAADADADAAHARVGAALAAVGADWRPAGLAAPLYAWPIAALAWIRIRPDRDSFLLHTWCLGDCKILLGLPDGGVDDLDPYDNAFEQALQQSVATLAAGGMADAGQRFAALLPTLRARREQQQGLDAPEVLCLEPRGGFAARRRTWRAPPGARLLAMTDGFYRLVDPYGLHDDEGLVRACAGDGLDAVLERLRQVEAARDTARLSVKGADDASAIMLELGSQRRQNQTDFR